MGPPVHRWVRDATVRQRWRHRRKRGRRRQGESGLGGGTESAWEGGAGWGRTGAVEGRAIGDGRPRWFAEWAYSSESETLGLPVTGCCQTHCRPSPSECPILTTYFRTSSRGVGGVDSADQLHLAFVEPSLLEDGVASQCGIRRVVDDGQALLGPAACHVKQPAGAVRASLSAGGFVIKVSL